MDTLLSNRAAPAYAVAFSPRENFIAASSDFNTVHLWLGKGEVVPPRFFKLSGSNQAILPMAVPLGTAVPT